MPADVTAGAPEAAADFSGATASPTIALVFQTSRGGVVRVRVDADKCQGHNRCYSLAPELFEVDDFGYASARGDGAVPPDLEPKAKLAAANCPEYAVLVDEEA